MSVKVIDVMNNELYTEYRNMFNCIIAYSYINGFDIIGTENHDCYSLEGIAVDEINTLMKESIEKKENILLHKVLSKKLFFENHPERDY